MAILLLAHNAATQVNEYFWDVNLDGANLIASPTERGGIR
jgi:hypothetical protein